MTSIGYLVCAIVYSNTADPTWLYAFIALRAVATVYSYCWDIYMDWGLMHDGRYLRDTLMFAPAVYYIAALSNLLLRCLWVLPLIALTLPEGSYLKTF